MRNAVNASGSSFEPPSLYEAGQDRIRETSRSGLLGGDQTVVVLSKFYKFVETRARHWLTSSWTLAGSSVNIFPYWNYIDKPCRTFRSLTIGSPQRLPERLSLILGGFGRTGSPILELRGM